jgi:hypothetical protein
MFSVDNPKAVKAQKLGWLNAINYMAPHKLSGVNLCPFASKGCIKLCLGEHSGNAALYPTVIKSRIAKAQYFMKDRKAFMAEMIGHIRTHLIQARNADLRLCVRLNGATDIAWERQYDQDGFTVFANFPAVQFVDYTKSKARALAHARGEFPSNYHLTFSRSETNEADCREVLAAGGNVAVVFSQSLIDGMLDDKWRYLGAPVISGDTSDLRHLDPRGGYVVALSPKGAKAKRDKSGFVVRS